MTIIQAFIIVAGVGVVAALAMVAFLAWRSDRGFGTETYMRDAEERFGSSAKRE